MIEIRFSSNDSIPNNRFTCDNTELTSQKNYEIKDTFTYALYGVVRKCVFLFYYIQPRSPPVLDFDKFQNSEFGGNINERKN